MLLGLDTFWEYSIINVCGFINVMGLDAYVPPPNSYAEALTPSLAVFGNGASREVIRIE